MQDRESALAAMRDFVVRNASGFLHNAIAEYRVTCSVCATPVDGYPRCFKCNEHVQAAGAALADRTAILTYAIKDTQSHYVMRHYKAPS